MEFEADLTLVALHDPTDFKGLKVTARRAEHLWVTREEFVRLAGAHAEDPAWKESLEKMFEFAQSRGWVNEEGAVRAHVEWE